MEKIKVYISSGFEFMYDIKELIKELKNLSYVQLVVPELVESDITSFVNSDISILHRTDIFVVYMPKPSIGASAELGYFKAVKPHGLAVAYKSVKHPWIDYFCYRAESIDRVKEIIHIYYKSHKIY